MARFIIESYPVDVSEFERARRLAVVYDLLLDVGGQQQGAAQAGQPAQAPGPGRDVVKGGGHE